MGIAPDVGAGLVPDSSVVISAERNRQSVADFIESILKTFGPVEISLSPVTVAELVHGVFRARTAMAGQRRREFIEELVSLVPVHPATNAQAGWLARSKVRRRRRGMCCLLTT